MEEEAPMDSDTHKEIAPALISVHPLDKFVVVAIGSVLRVFDLGKQCSVSLSDDTDGPSHSDAIRAISFDTKGRFFTSAGDDKLVKVWKTDSWQCVQTVCSEKRVTAVAISHDGLFATFADKFGAVWVFKLNEDKNDKKAVPLLGHYCSIITSLEFSPDGGFIATADRDFKIRITKFPRQPLQGAHEIQSFCLGHTDFVSALSFVSSSNHPSGFLLSGSGDGTVRMWDFISGSLLDTCEVGLQAGLADSSKGKEPCSAITDVHSLPDGSVVAVATQSLNGVILLKCDLSARCLCLAKVVSVGNDFVPTKLSLSFSLGYLWMIMGASNMPNPTSTKLLSPIKLLSGIQKYVANTNEQEIVLLDDKEVPGGEKLLMTLQGSLDVFKEEYGLAATASALKAAMHNLLIKKQYSADKRELRKKDRNDKKLKQ